MSETDVLMEPEAGPSRLAASPRRFELNTTCRAFLDDLGISEGGPTSGISHIIQDAAFGRGSIVEASFLEELSRIASQPWFTLRILEHFGPLVPDILAKWLDGSAQTSIELQEERLEALAIIADVRPDLWSFVTAFIRQTSFASSPLHYALPELTTVDSSRLQKLLLAYIRLLIADPHIAARHGWPVDPLHTLRNSHRDPAVRLLAIRALSLQRGWSETKRMDTEKQCIGSMDELDVSVVFGSEAVTLDTGGFEVRSRHIDGWLLSIREAQRVQSARGFISHEDKWALPIDSAHLSPRIALVADTLLLRAKPTKTTLPFIHVSTSATDSALRQIFSRLSLGDPMLITSPPSSGKTHILHYLSSQLFPDQQPTNRILTIPLADTTIDVKSLIGTYVSSPTKPGTFEWMEGALAKAVRAGRWVVFDDIDRASTEMLVTISGLTMSLQRGRTGRRARLAIPGREEIEAGDSFALFATRTIHRDVLTPATFFGHHDFVEVHLDSPTNEDILAILAASFPGLPRSITSDLVGIWQELRPFAKIGGQVKNRDVGLRDLEKWCARVHRNLPPASVVAALEQNPLGIFANPVFQDEVMLEAVDIFMASLDAREPSLQKRQSMIKVVASRIGMDEERAIALIEARRPQLELSVSSRQLRAGRTTLPVHASPRRRQNTDSRPFALTKPSLVLLERVASTLVMGEPTLLVGETGTGKTTAVQHIASICHKPLTVLNLSTQTESSDLLGGFKPIDASVSARLLQARWAKLFSETFSMGKAQNGAYLEAASKALSGRKWARLAELWGSSARRAVDRLMKKDEGDQPMNGDGQSGSPRKRRKINSKVTKAGLLWQSLLVDIADFDLHHVKMKSKLVFSFVEGPLVKALRDGEWLLLDEVNLASQETLEAISTLLEGTAASLVLTERGDVEPIPRHPDFRLFACMNPATDVGKKDLPPNLRARFTELYVPPPDDDREALTTIVSQYLGDAAAGDKAVILDVVEMYTTLKRLSASKEIVDGSNIAPHFSMRTLARALMFAVETAPLFGLRRGLWEGCLMAFTMSLDVDSAKKAHGVCEKHLLTPMKNARAVLSQIPSLPSGADPDDFVRFGPFWLQRGPIPPVGESRYIITSSVQAKLSDLARVILTHRYPVLIQGPTSAGKTSAVEFLARQTGHRFVRINNHEHTDIQEYLGTYVTDPQSGNLVFQEGLLVTAVRQGHWIVLDELNLAPTDVLEALNRLLDDNRELVIPETQEIIKPHPNFILFATQNPPGLYAGRKVLSRAFRNRFLEVHFDDVPKDELETILCQRCQIAPSYAKKIVQVFEELRHRRQASRVFESKSSFATLRDLFRWAERGAVGYQQLAEDGYMLLAERARQAEDKVVIKQVIENIMKVTVYDKDMYKLFDSKAALDRLAFETVPECRMVWTNAMQRLFVLVAFALAHNEPVLLVGETGCGKTSICEVVAAAFKQVMVGVNCHQNMETADLLGSQRPVRSRNERRVKVIANLSKMADISGSATDDELLAVCHELLKRPDADRNALQSIQREIKALSALFEWSDGPLVHAMHAGDLLLLDEVSLADDSVLERLNSVLEPGRTLVLAEKGGTDIDEATLVAHPNFHVVATMNPGGDFGKKELSPALRNRFTEIWVPPLNDRADLLQIIGQSWKHKDLSACGEPMLDYFNWFGARIGDTAGLGLRDILAWVNFADRIVAQGQLGPAEAYHHGGQMVLIDGLESLPQVAGMSLSSVAALRQDCLRTLSEFAGALGPTAINLGPSPAVSMTSEDLSIGGFGVKRGPLGSVSSKFRLDAPTTALNAMRVMRGCQLPKAILLEGSPGVGKTSLVSALAAIAGFNLQRINLSDQTDLIDLFGSDLPVEGGNAGEFQWRDAAFLDAMQKGDWVLLDEMNLASQTVLEGLNAVLDHRGTVFIPELGRSFDRHPNFRVFAAQNPLQQGGGRKGLPKSFLNRFTKVYLQEHTPEDLMIICKELHSVSTEVVQKMIQFNEGIRDATMVTRSIGVEGSPWEFNLRDLFRWFSLMSTPNGLELTADPVEHLRLVYLHRFRNERDRATVASLFTSAFAVDIPSFRPTPFITPTHLQIGHSLISRTEDGSAAIDSLVPHAQLEIAESVLKCVEMGWLVILAGHSGIGKRNLVQAISDAAGRPLGEFAMHPGVDTSEILGSFEQQDFGRLLDLAYRSLLDLIDDASDAGAEVRSTRERLEQSHTACLRSKEVFHVQAFRDFGAELVAQLPNTPNTVLATAHLGALAKAGPDSTGFAWVDGQLLHAIRNGGWFLISNANLCSASVLDRLNSLCESNGVLVMSEKGSETGSPEVITPHPDFRLFMTYDPKYGELSRAMRNRGVELYVSGSESARATDNAAFSAADDSLAQGILRHGRSLLGGDEANASEISASLSAQSHCSAPIIKRAATGAGGPSPDIPASLADLSSQVSSLNTVGSPLDPNFFAGLPIDVSINPSIGGTVVNGTFRLIQALLRNTVASQATAEWIADSNNAKSILTISKAAAIRGPSRVKSGPGAEVYPFVSALRAALRSKVVAVCVVQGSVSLNIVAAVEQILVMLEIFEQRARSRTFDYSSTQLLATWLQALLAEMPALDDVLPLLANLVTSVQITSGQGQAEIWAAFRQQSDLTLSPDLLAAIDSVTDARLRFSVLEALVACRKDELGVEDLASIIDGLPPTGAMNMSVVPKWQNWAMLNAIELHALTQQSTPITSAIRLLVKDHSKAVSSLSDLALLAYSSDEAPSVFFASTSRWLKNLWTQASTDASSQGPATLFAAAQIQSVLRFSQAENTPMAEIPQQEAALRFTSDAVVFSASTRPDHRQDSLRIPLAALTKASCSFAFGLGVNGAQVLSAFDIAINTRQSLVAVISEILGVINNQSSSENLAVPFQQFLFRPLSTVREHPSNLSALGEVYLGLGYFLLSMYVTNIPIDPAVRRVLLGEVVALRVSSLEEELAAIEASELSLKGTAESTRTLDVRQRLAAVVAEQGSLGPTSSRTTDAARLAVLFNEVHSFLSDALDETKTGQLCSSLRQGGTQALQREEGFQAITGSFVHRLESNYADLADLVQPIITAVLFTKFGLRCLARQLELNNAKPSATTANMLAFPRTIAAAVDVEVQNIPSRLYDTASLLPAVVSTTQRNIHLPGLISRLDSLYSTWSAIRLREQQEAADAESLYRVRKTDIEVLPEHEQEENEFAELFPTFEDVTEEAAPVKAATKTSGEDKMKFLPSRMLAFHRILSSAFGDAAFSSQALGELVGEILKHDFDASSHDESLDRISFAFQVRQLQSAHQGRSTLASQPNFYLGPNQPEIFKAHDLLARLTSRLKILIEEWPEQMVLVHILDRVERVLYMDIQSPVAKVLSALEQLLVHTDDWEAYANRDNSLKSFQNEMSDLIIKWRKLELSSWMRLLDDQAAQYVEADAEWTLRLYGALIHGAVNAVDSAEHIKTVLPMLNSYLTTSTYGHYASRIATLAAFEKMAREFAVLSPGLGAVLGKISTMLYNVIGNTHLFAGRIAESLRTQRAVLDKAIKDFIKLASWKDVNVFALKASAQKSHRQLHKSIRKFRELLQQPVSPIMADLNSLCPQDPSQPSPAVIAPVIDVSPPAAASVESRKMLDLALPDHLANLGTTFDRYQKVLLGVVKPSDAPTVGTDLDEMAVEVIETVAMLAKATPSTLTKENEKVINNLSSRKRKAFADLLKALRQSGFSQNVRADAMEKQASSTWLVDRPALSLEGLPESMDRTTLSKIQNYHQRTQVLVVALRAAFNGHHPDINSQDLQRGIGYVESMFATSLAVRDGMVAQLDRMRELYSTVTRLRDVASSQAVTGGDPLKKALAETEIQLRDLLSALGEAEEGVQHFRSLQGVPVNAGDLAVISDLREPLKDLVRALEAVNAGARSVALFSRGEAELLAQAADLKAEATERFAAHLQRSPELTHLLRPLGDMVQRLNTFTVPADRADPSASAWKRSDDLIQKLLVVAQQVKARDSKPVAEDERIHVPSEYKAQQEFAASLHISTILEDVNGLISTLSTELQTGISSSTVQLLHRVLPFVDSLLQTFAANLVNHAYDVRSTYKLTYVVGRVMLDLAQKGFCKPQEQDDSKGGEDGQTAEGTGMGSGTGDKNVSNEIEDESQVEGLQGEKEEEDQDEGGQDEDDAVSMDDDFEGELGEGKEKENDDEGESEDGEEDHDEHVGDVDPLDPGAVDEKFWGDEEKEEKDQGGREDLMNEKNQEEGEAELSAKEKEEASKDKEKEKKDEEIPEGKEGEQPEEGETKEGPEGEGEDQEMEGEELDQGEEGEEDQRDDGPPATQDEVAMPEGDKLDLPEDLNFEDEDVNADGDEGEDFKDEEMDGGEEGEEVDNDDAEMASQDDGEQVDDAPPAMEPTEEESNEPEATVQNLDLSAANDSQAQESTEQGGGQGGDQQQPQEKDAEDGKDETQAEDSQDAEQQPAGQGAAPQDASGGPSAEQEADGPVDSSGAPLPADTQGQPQNRSLGDIMKDIRRRRDEILAQQERDQSTTQPDAPQEAPGQVEYLGEEDEGNEQALGAAGEEDRQKLADLNIVDEEDESDPATAPGMEDDGDAEDAQGTDSKPQEANATFKADTADQPRATEKALTQADIGGSAPTDRPDDGMNVDELDGEVEAKPLVPEEDEDVDIDLSEVKITDIAQTEGESTWRQYSSLTSDLSYALCEQLRLILEPTLATRLQGDFRTGKRLNMRKIIPYIASEYTKDKIWLRRTKPSRREYQVLLSLDDSRSMADSHSVHLAYQTLALVSQAMNKLEVGQVAIAKFGQSVDILHPFGTGFTDADGAKVMSSFGFDQHRTDVVALVERTLSFLGEARQSQAGASAPDLWQLQIIISDGVCQDHARLRTLLRQALEERVMIVFIIIDSLHQGTTAAPTSTAVAAGSAGNARPSILSMQTVEYKSINGEMQLEMTRYLDTFPFEFFVVLRDVEALPGVLSDTLRQWMARVSQSQE